MPRIWVLSRDRFPGERAHSINQIRMCDGFADSGYPVSLLFPDHPFRFKDNIDEFYGVRNTIEYMPLTCWYIPALVSKEKGGRGWLGSLGERINTDLVGMSTSLFIWLRLMQLASAGKLSSGDIIYGRSGYFSLIGAKALMRILGRRVKVAIEVHIPPKGRWGLLSYWITRLDHIFVISENLKKYLMTRDAVTVHLLPDGVDITDFDETERSEARRKLTGKLGINPDEKIVSYAGHLYLYKGVEDLITAVGGTAGVAAVIVGGMESDIARCRQYALAMGFNNIHFTGFVRPREVAQYLAAADICVYTLRPDAEIKDYTSPIKLFEYLASGNATIAAAVPGVKEIISPGVSGLFYEPGNVSELRERITDLLIDEEYRLSLGREGKLIAQHYSWTSRARHVLNVLSIDKNGHLSESGRVGSE